MILTKKNLSFRNLSRIMKRNGFDVSLSANGVVEIVKGEGPKNDPKIRAARVIGGVAVVVVIATLYGLTGSFKFVGIGISILIGIAVVSTRSSEVDNENYDSISFKKESIVLSNLKGSNEKEEINVSDIEHIEINIPSNDAILNGRIIFHLVNSKQINFLSIVGESERYVGDDLEYIVNFINEVYYGERD